jgi:hypothetical protein
MMRAKTLTAPMGGYSLTAGFAFLIAAYFYVFLGAAPVSGVASIHNSFGLQALISLDGFFTLGHMAVYGLLTLCFCIIFKSPGKRSAIAATLMIIGVAIEFLQEEFFGRQFQLGDAIANTAGIAVALAILYVIGRYGAQPNSN